MLCKSSPKALYNRRICLDFTVYCFYVILFRLFESLFGIFTFFGLANRPLFAATKQCKSPQKRLSTKLEIKSKQILNRRQQKTATQQKCNCIGGSRGYNNPIYGQFTGIYVEKEKIQMVTNWARKPLLLLLQLLLQRTYHLAVVAQVVT